MTDHVRLHRRGEILHLELNRPEKKNALTVEMYGALADALAALRADPAARAVLITGAGDSFTAGNDLRDFLDRPPGGEDSPVLRFLRELISAPVPVVAAVQGLAVGIGTTLLLHCDLVYAGKGARLHLPFVPLGLVPEAGSSMLLPRRIGHARAAEMLLLGEPMTADEALAAGLVSAVVDEAELLDHAWSRCERLAALPPEAVRTTKSLMRAADRDALAAHMREESARFLERLQSSEAREAMNRFFSGRGGGSE